MHRELGVKTRLSTIGYIRHNITLNQMQSRINKEDILIEGLGGVRLSFTPYSIGYKSETKEFSRDDYQQNMANFFRFIVHILKDLKADIVNFAWNSDISFW